MNESQLESYALSAIKVVFQAELLVDASDIYLSWFIDITDIAEAQLLEQFANAMDIQIMMYARTTTGIEIVGEGYLYPNLSFHCAAIKGEGEIIGYEQIKQAASQ
jgi:hypothetical protein